jgi:hypothetical protein
MAAQGLGRCDCELGEGPCSIAGPRNGRAGPRTLRRLCLGINASEQALKPTIRHCRHLSIAEADGVSELLHSTPSTIASPATGSITRGRITLRATRVSVAVPSKGKRKAPDGVRGRASRRGFGLVTFAA